MLWDGRKWLNIKRQETGLPQHKPGSSKNEGGTVRDIKASQPKAGDDEAEVLHE